MKTELYSLSANVTNNCNLFLDKIFFDTFAVLNCASSHYNFKPYFLGSSSEANAWYAGIILATKSSLSSVLAVLILCFGMGPLLTIAVLQNAY